MANIKVLILPILLMFSFFVTWQFTKPLFEDGMMLRNKKIPELSSVLGQEKDLQQRTEKLYEEGSADGGMGETIKKTIPEEKEIKNTLVQLDTLAKNNGLVIEDFKADEGNNSSLDQSTLGLVQSGGKAYTVISGSVQIAGGYGKLKQFIKDMNKLDRITNIKNVSIVNSNDTTQTTIGKYLVDFDFYWQPFISPEIVKAGLEKKE